VRASPNRRSAGIGGMRRTRTRNEERERGTRTRNENENEDEDENEERFSSAEKDAAPRVWWRCGVRWRAGLKPAPREKNGRETLPHRWRAGRPRSWGRAGALPGQKRLTSSRLQVRPAKSEPWTDEE